MPAARRAAEAARASRPRTVAGRAIARLRVLRMQLLDPCRPLPAAGPACRANRESRPPLAHGVPARPWATLERRDARRTRRARSRTISSPSGTQEGIRRLSQGFHPRQILVDDFGPGGQLPLQAGRPIRALIAGFLPALGVLKLLGEIVRHPQPDDQLMALHLAAQQPPQRLDRHRHRRVAPGFFAQNSQRIGDPA